MYDILYRLRPVRTCCCVLEVSCSSPLILRLHFVTARSAPFAVAAWSVYFLLIIPLSRSMGTGKMMVVFFSAEMVLSVWR